MYDSGNYVLPVKINGVVEMVALVDTGAITIAIGSTLRTCSAIIDMGKGTLCIDDGVIRHTYFPKPRSKSYMETFEIEGEDDWLGNFGVGKDEDGNAKYGLVAPLCLDIEDDMERALAMEAYFNPYSNLKSHKDTLPNPLIAKYEKKNKENTITYSLQPVSNGNLKWKDFPSIERHTYCERNIMKLEYIYKGDGDVFVDYSWERALSIDDEVYLEWHILTLPEFALVLGLFTEDEVNHRLFSVHFGKLEVDDRQFDHREYWTKVGKPTLTNHKEVLVKKPLMQIMHKLISRGVNLAWIIADQLYKHAPGTKESSIICVGHCVTRIASSLGYCVDDEIKKCSEPIDCELEWEVVSNRQSQVEIWLGMIGTLSLEKGIKVGMLERELYVDLIITIASKNISMPILHHLANQGGDDYFTSAMPNFYGNSSGYAVGVSSGGAGFDDEDMDE
ncbi:hypothetical protein Tco_0242882 [Tanacetum coccineum]